MGTGARGGGGRAEAGLQGLGAGAASWGHSRPSLSQHSRPSRSPEKPRTRESSSIVGSAGTVGGGGPANRARGAAPERCRLRRAASVPCDGFAPAGKVVGDTRDGGGGGPPLDAGATAGSGAEPTGSGGGAGSHIQVCTCANVSLCGSGSTKSRGRLSGEKAMSEVKAARSDMLQQATTPLSEANSPLPLATAAVRVGRCSASTVHRPASRSMRSGQGSCTTVPTTFGVVYRLENETRTTNLASVTRSM